MNFHISNNLIYALKFELISVIPKILIIVHLIYLKFCESLWFNQQYNELYIEILFFKVDSLPKN